MRRFLRISRRSVVRHSELWLDKQRREARKDAYSAALLIQSSG